MSNSYNVNGTTEIAVGYTGQRPINSLILPANPDQQINANLRVTVVQTEDSIYTDTFGVGIQTLKLTGTTAWDSAQGSFNGVHVDGNTAARHLYKDILQFYFSLAKQTTSPNGVTMTIYDDAFLNTWEVEPISDIQLSRTSASPMTLNYAVDFVVISDLMSSISLPKVPDPVQQTLKSTKSIQKHIASHVSQATQSTQQVKQTPNLVYTVASGDSLWTIAQQFLPKYANSSTTSAFVRQIVEQNHIKNENLIFPGERLVIPQ